MTADVLEEPHRTDRRWGLPAQLSSFVGREREVRNVAETLVDARLLTLTGSGGCGKTRLAWEVASSWPDAVVWAELAPATDFDAVVRTLAHTLGVRPLPGENEVQAVAALLRTRPILVVLDNCEHVLQAAADLCRALLDGCVAVRVLATSQEPLGLAGEVDWRVPPLSLPVDDDAKAALVSDAVRLFIERGRLVDPTFTLDAGSVASVVDVCRRLDGIPLAIELAAARMRVLSLAQIATGLDDALGILGRGPRVAPPRQQTLRDSIQWSHDLLGDDERVLLRRLGVFAGSFSLPFVEAVCAEEFVRPDSMLDLISGLVERSLLQVVERGVTARYRLLETVRQFAVEQAERAGESRHLRDRHRDAYLAFAEQQRNELLTPRQPEVLDLLDGEATNLVAAVRWGAGTDPELARRLCLALELWWRARGRTSEAESAFALALDGGAEAPSALRCRALMGRAWMLGNRGEMERNRTLGEEALAMAERLGDEALVKEALLGLANWQVNVDPVAAKAPLERCRALARQSGDEWLLARCALALGTVAWYRQDIDEHARCTAGQAERVARLGDRRMRAYDLLAEGGLRYPRLEHEEAAARFREAIATARDGGEPFAERGALLFLAQLDCCAGRPRRARTALEGAREDLVKLGGSFVLVWVCLMEGIAWAADGSLTEASARLENVIAGRLGTSAVAQTWARLELAEVQRLSGTGAGGQEAATALEEARTIGNPWLAARAQTILGRLHAARGEWAEAESLHHEALDAIVEHQLALELPQVLDALATVADGLDGREDAARLLAAARELRAKHELVPWPAQRAEIEELTERVGSFAGTPDPTVAEVVAWVRRTRGRRGRPARGWESLTPTELEVVRHASAGLTNPQIGARMFITRSTVKTHLAHIFDKLGIGTRTELAHIAVQRGDALEP